MPAEDSSAMGNTVERWSSYSSGDVSRRGCASDDVMAAPMRSDGQVLRARVGRPRVQVAPRGGHRRCGTGRRAHVVGVLTEVEQLAPDGVGQWHHPVFEPSPKTVTWPPSVRGWRSAMPLGIIPQPSGSGSDPWLTHQRRHRGQRSARSGRSSHLGEYSTVGWAIAVADTGAGGGGGVGFSSSCLTAS